MDSQTSRAQHLKKIEALLTIGAKPWAYADGMARRMYDIARVQWIEDLEQLRGIITALRKQAKREGWDLNG